MTLPVTDIRSNHQDQIAHAIKVLGRSKDRIAVFVELHRGKKRIKTVTELSRLTRLSRKRVLEEAKKLDHKQIIKQTKRNGDIAYERDDFYYAQKRQILSLVKNSKKFKQFPTKYSPRIPSVKVSISAPKSLVRTATITVDDIESFAKVRKIKTAPSSLSMLEKRFKRGIQLIIREPGSFKDWGGENSDLYTTRLKINGARHSSALAFKGKATRGVLTPARMGKNGDQIQRLFVEDAEVYIVQYGQRIAPSVLQQMAVYAQAKSLTTGKKIFYGIIDGYDSSRIVAAYPKLFKSAPHKM
ncbi:hypothetical protein L0337_24640 [candidate division KSB1 bacterium]|nr:hypothetical protein [candidate division KSB1 bacterium]